MIPAGILTIDKPSGPTSHDVVQMVRRLAGRRVRVGHCGTLDPLASGLLVLTVAAATRLSRYFVGLDKEYEGRVRLGEATDTFDAAGEITERMPVPPDLDEQAVGAAARRLTGTIEQEPPAYSAIKVEGKRLHARARAGEEVRAPVRRIEIHDLEITALELPDIRIRVRCSSGTYVRSIARDLGALLRLPAHLVSLVRTAVGPFALRDAAPPPADTDELRARIVPPARALDFLPAMLLDANQVDRMRVGGSLPLGDLPVASDSPHSPVRAIGPDGELVAMAEIERVGDAGVLQPRVVLSN
ncbi:MAG: tRNA pseudouridine(55) synthase TruB [Gemmatimonadetes bacterium]|nr:tRNA pseudouridine(55) synthase TruB [Gemmatimonadota bacterium]